MDQLAFARWIALFNNLNACKRIDDAVAANDLLALEEASKSGPTSKGNLY